MPLGLFRRCGIDAKLDYHDPRPSPHHRFKTIVTVTGVLAATVLAIVLFALGIDM